MVIRGWTPGFNDGEPCTHGQETGVITKFKAYGGPLEYLHEEMDDDPEVGLFTHLGIPVPDGVIKQVPIAKYGEETPTEVDQVQGLLSGMEPIISSAYFTNFQLNVYRNDAGVVKVDESEYDCGY